MYIQEHLTSFCDLEHEVRPTKILSFFLLATIIHKCLINKSKKHIIVTVNTTKFYFDLGAFGLPESESGFEIMILIHRFI